MTKTARAGQLVRFIDIPTETNIIDGIDSPKEFADSMKSNCAKYYGTAGPAFVEALITRYKSATAIRDSVQELIQAASSRLKPTVAPPEVERATNRFALVEAAGLLASRLGILPLSEDDIRNSVSVVHSAWLKEAVSIPDVVRGVASVRDFIQKHRESRFRQIKDNAFDDESSHAKIKDLAGYWDTSKKLYLLTPGGFKDACIGFDQKLVAAELDKYNLLFKNEKLRAQSKHQIPGDSQQSRFYALKDEIVAWSSDIPSIPHKDSERDAVNP